MGDNNPLEIRVEPSWQRLVDYWTGKGLLPTEKEAEQALQELLRDIRLENNIVHREVIDSLFLP